MGIECSLVAKLFHGERWGSVINCIILLFIRVRNFMLNHISVYTTTEADETTSSLVNRTVYNYNKTFTFLDGLRNT